MPKSQIIIDLVEDRVSLDQSLTRLMVLARDVKNKKLEMWARKELNGYDDVNELPEYRKSRSSSLIYSGINGGFQVQNTPLPLTWISEEHRCICDLEIVDGIKYVIDLSNSKTAPKRDLTVLAGDVEERSGGGIMCTSISQIIPQTVYLSILSKVKTMMITALCELEDKYGSLDKLGIDITTKTDLLINSNNTDLNRAVFNINIPKSEEEKKQPWYAKVCWNIVVPIITAIIGALAATLLIKVLKI